MLGEAVIVYFLADGQVDFHNLSVTSKNFKHGRLRIGVRDEAKLLADYGDCGQQFAVPFSARCRLLSMKMAKLQRATLDLKMGSLRTTQMLLRYGMMRWRSPKPVSRAGADREAHEVIAQDLLAGQLTVKTEQSPDHHFQRRCSAGRDGTG